MFCSIKGGHWMMDNAEVNDTFMAALEIELDKRDINFNAKDRRIMCFPHIVNIATGHVVQASTSLDFSDDQDDFDIDDHNAAGSRDVIALTRTTVRAVRASGQRLERFHETIVTGNEKGWFQNEQDEVMKVPVLQLHADCKTRWDSVWSMIDRFIELRLVSLPLI